MAWCMGEWVGVEHVYTTWICGLDLEVGGGLDGDGEEVVVSYEMENYEKLNTNLYSFMWRWGWGVERPIYVIST